MNLKISGHHLELTPSLREYVQSKLERIKRHFDNVIDVTVILAVDDNTEKTNDSAQKSTFTCEGKTCMWKAKHKICTQRSIC